MPMTRTVASYEDWDKGTSPSEQATDHANDIRAIGYRASVSQRTRKDGTTVYTVRANAPRDDWRV